jgi:hypothetical protein
MPDSLWRTSICYKLEQWESATLQQFSARRCSFISLLVGPAQYPIGLLLVVLLNHFGLWEVHTWKELLFIQIYIIGAIVSIILAVKGWKRSTGRSLLAWFALVLAVVNVFPTLIVIGGW